MEQDGLKYQNHVSLKTTEEKHHAI